MIARVSGRRGKSVNTTIRLGLQRSVQNALGDDLGGIAVIRPRDGAVLALAGLAVSAPQPPGSSMKIVTLAAALQNGVAKPSSSYPVRTAATLSGVRLRNAGDESCGGSLANSFAHSCNSVFGPLGRQARPQAARRRRRALRLQREADAPRGQGEHDPEGPQGQPRGRRRRDRAGADAGHAARDGERRGDDREPRRADRPWLAGGRPPRKRVVSAKVAGQVRDMMVGVVRSGTGTAAAIPGVTVAGKTGTAELVPTADAAQNPENTTAWFVAFAPAENPRVAVAVMLPRAGQGGASAAPIAKRVIQAALR